MSLDIKLSDRLAAMSIDEATRVHLREVNTSKSPSMRLMQKFLDRPTRSA